MSADTVLARALRTHGISDREYALLDTPELLTRERCPLPVHEGDAPCLLCENTGSLWLREGDLQRVTEAAENELVADMNDNDREGKP